MLGYMALPPFVDGSLLARQNHSFPTVNELGAMRQSQSSPNTGQIKAGRLWCDAGNLLENSEEARGLEAST